jgi:hypothetical protein
MTKQRAGAGGAILLAVLLCGNLAGTSPTRGAEPTPAKAPDDPAIARGKTLFISYGCGWCHEDGGRNASSDAVQSPVHRDCIGVAQVHRVFQRPIKVISQSFVTKRSITS